MGARGPGAKSKGGRPRRVVTKDAAKAFRALLPLAVRRLREVLETKDAEQRHLIAAARIVAEVGGRPSDEPEETDNELRIVYVNGRASTGDSMSEDSRPQINYHELERQQALADSLGTTLERVKEIEAEAERKRLTGR